MSSNAQRFAAEVIAAFERVGLHTREEVRDAGGPSTTKMSDLRKVADGELTMGEPRGDVLKRIDTAARWPPGSARTLWRTGQLPEQVAATVGPGDKDARYVTAPGARQQGGITNEDLYREILRSRAEYDQVRADVRTLSERVARLEDGPEPVDRPGGQD